MTRQRLSKHFTVEEFDCKDGTPAMARDHHGRRRRTAPVCARPSPAAPSKDEPEVTPYSEESKP
jgi:hypothetical protein